MGRLDSGEKIVSNLGEGVRAERLQAKIEPEKLE
jgi:hypothetical protein